MTADIPHNPTISRDDWERPDEPPVHAAARIGDIAALARLIAAGVDIDQRADLEFDHGPYLKGLTPLMIAARSYDGATAQTLRWLVDHGANTQARSKAGVTAAWYAAGLGGRFEPPSNPTTTDHADRLKYLLGLGLDPNESAPHGRSLMTEAAGAGDPARVAALLSLGVPPHVSQSTKEQGSVAELMSKLLPAGLWNDVSAVPCGSVRGFAIPIFCAASSGSGECVRLLLEAGADVNTRDSSGQTPLMVAGSAEVVRVLVSAGADLDARDVFGKDAFRSALDEPLFGTPSFDARLDLARAFVAAGVDIEHVNQFDHSRLMSAAFSVNADLVEILIKLGADVHRRDPSGATALHWICWQGENSDPAANQRCERIIRALVAAGIPVDARGNEGATPMHEAAGGDWGNATAVRTLLALGAAPDPSSNQGVTPLMLAAMNGETACIKLLCDAGADPTRKAHNGRSTIIEATEHWSRWKSIVDAGPSADFANFQIESYEKLAQTLGELPFAPQPGFDALMEKQGINHPERLKRAEEAMELLRQYVQTRTSHPRCE